MKVRTPGERRGGLQSQLARHVRLTSRHGVHGVVQQGVAAEHEAVEIRLGPRIWVPVERDLMTIRRDRANPERPRPDRSGAAVLRSGHVSDPDILEQVFGDDAVSHREREAGPLGLERELDLQLAELFDLQLLPVLLRRLLVVRTLEDAVREHHVVGCERLAVGPSNTWAKVEDIAEAVVPDGPTGGKQPHDLLVLVQSRQALVDQRIDVPGVLLLLEERVEWAG